jgi:DSF synthase
MLDSNRVAYKTIKGQIIMIESVNLDSLTHGSAGDFSDAQEVAGGRAASVTIPSLQPAPEPALAPDGVGQSKLFDLAQIDVKWEPETGSLWAFLTPPDRPNYSLALLREAMIVHDETRRLFSSPQSGLRYFVLGSRFPGVFSLGGDLEMFADCITTGDRMKLRDYGRSCIEVVDRLWRCNDLPMINIGLVQGDALGGGLETLLCCDVVIAERQARFGLPEVLFGLFPGMGAYSLLARKLGHAMAEKMILSGKIYSAQEMLDLGLVNQIVEEGEGEEATRAYIAANLPRHAGMLGTYQAGRRVQPLEMGELMDIVDGWVEAALKLTEKDLRLMRRLANAQTRLNKC